MQGGLESVHRFRFLRETCSGLVRRRIGYAKGGGSRTRCVCREDQYLTINLEEYEMDWRRGSCFTSDTEGLER